VPVFRLTSMEATPSEEDSKRTAAFESLYRVFANNADAWRYLDNLGPRTTVMADGFYLTKADDGKQQTVERQTTAPTSDK